MTSWEKLQKSITSCNACPRLRQHCQTIAAEKRRAFSHWNYWGKPIPNLGSQTARLLLVGLAPAAHGANRTGRMFTGDRSGDFLFRAMHETGFANQAECSSRDDGLELIDAAITAVAHCAPPQNKPTNEEIANCSPFLESTLELMPNLKGILALGKIGFDACLRTYKSRGWLPKGQRPVFGHGAFYRFPSGPFLLAAFHPSQQNTFTGKLTPEMLKNVFNTAKSHLG